MSVGADIYGAGGRLKRYMMNKVTRWGKGCWSEEDGGKFGNYSLDLGMGWGGNEGLGER